MASKHLNVSPSAISLQICGTEASYNVKLFDRDSDLPSMGRCFYFAQDIANQPIISILKQTLLKSVRAEAIQKARRSKRGVERKNLVVVDVFLENFDIQCHRG